MSIECRECEHDLRGGHDPSCSRVAGVGEMERAPVTQELVQETRTATPTAPTWSKPNLHDYETAGLKALLDAALVLRRQDNERIAALRAEIQRRR